MAVDQEETQEAATKERSFDLPCGCKPWKAVGDADGIRHGYLHKREDGLWLLTTDSYIAAAIKVEGDAEEGFVPRGVLKLMRRDRDPSTSHQLSATEWRVDLSDGHRYAAVSNVGSKPYPVEVLEEAGLWEPPKDCQASDVLGLDPRLAVRLQKALGFPLDGPHAGVYLQLFGRNKAVRVTHPSYPDRVGLQMPIRLTDG